MMDTYAGEGDVTMRSQYTRPRLRNDVLLSVDAVSRRLVVLFDAGVITPDATATVILRLCNGVSSVADIAALARRELAGLTDAAVAAELDRLADRRIIEWVLGRGAASIVVAGRNPVERQSFGWRAMRGTSVKEPDTTATRHRGLVLAALLSGTFMLLLDTTIVNLALSPITADLRAGESALQWIVSGYALAYGLTLLPAGWLGDRIGHKNVLMLGLAMFTVASLLCGLAGSPGQLIVWRVAQGAAAGAVNPSILAFIRLLYRDSERGRAFAAYGTVAGAATSLGPVLGGLIIEWDIADLSWRPVFLANLPVGVFAVAAVALLAPRTPTTMRRLDAVGLALIVAAMFAVTFPLTEGREQGWPLWTFLVLAASPLLFAAFTGWQLRLLRRGRDPLVDVRLFARRSFAAGVGLILAFFAGFIGLMFSLSLYLQNGLDHSTLAAGLIMMPIAIGTGVGSVVGNTVIAPRLGRGVLHLGSATVCLGIALLLAAMNLTTMPPAPGWMLGPLLVTGLGCGMIIGPNANIVLSGVPVEVAGVASGTMSTAQRLGTGLGIAIIGLVLFGSVDAAPQARDAVAVARDYTHATTLAMLCALGAVVVTGALAFLLPRHTATSTKETP